MGGGTSFPYLKTLIPSVRGSAVFWHNLLHSGTDNYFTKHAGCPVLMGNKIVMNKWIHSFGNEFRRPCKVGEFKEQNQADLFKQIL